LTLCTYVMSHSRKHVKAVALEAYPTPEDGQAIVRVFALRGGNILEVEYPSTERILCLLPARFHKIIWVKRGNYVIVEPFTELIPKGGKDIQAKVKGRVVHVLLHDHVKNLRKTNLWPQEWNEEDKATDFPPNHDSEEEELEAYLVNTNHRTVDESDSDVESSSSEED